jgi:hypothetical protein
MQKVIGIALVGAGLLGTIQVLWTQSGDFNAPTREPEQSMPEGWRIEFGAVGEADTLLCARSGDCHR